MSTYLVTYSNDNGYTEHTMTVTAKTLTSAYLEVVYRTGGAITNIEQIG